MRISDWSSDVCSSVLEDVDIAFQRGVRGAVEHWLRRTDEAMAAQLAAADLDAMRIRDSIAFAVRLRLEMAERHTEPVRRALAFLALPGNAGLAVRRLYRRGPEERRVGREGVVSVSSGWGPYRTNKK